MSMYPDDEEGIDAEEEEVTEAEEDDAEDNELARSMTNWPFDIDRIGRARDRVQTKDSLFLELIEAINRLQQSHGDADPALSHALADIDAHLRVHVLFVFRDPIGWVLSVLATMPRERQLAEIDHALGDLSVRRAQLLAQQSDNTHKGEGYHRG